ncbi:MAG: carboxymuconolactone decarboxylase family protein [Pantoea sp.]|uniref:carboxymuconolactone decarboxylase family protein n=1 Tax=Pantoea sp. TaxID=69393 RepID=UPI00238B4EB9|nr:carboxymuconolactone decarboxylase family protein [Pantoea sp.]MDE1185403.1 carboxymuconolactone decarboxylase family protein [Pantoea sp.]
MRLATLSLLSLTELLIGCVPSAVKNQSVPAPPSLAELGDASPALENYTQKYVENDLWKRPQLSPRDRSMVTVAALIARSDRVELPYHLNRAMNNGLTQSQAEEMLTQLAFYAGWPRVFSALPVAKKVFEARNS